MLKANNLPAPRAILTRLDALVHPALRWALVIGWTLMLTVMLVQSSSQPVIGPPAPPGTPDLRREIELTLGHVIGFSVLTALWWWTLKTALPSSRALFVSTGFALIFSVITEQAQTLVADRQASLYDMVVNWTVTILTAALIAEMNQRRTTTPQRTRWDRPYKARFFKRDALKKPDDTHNP